MSLLNYKVPVRKKVNYKAFHQQQKWSDLHVSSSGFWGDFRADRGLSVLARAGATAAFDRAVRVSKRVAKRCCGNAAFKMTHHPLLSYVLY